MNFMFKIITLCLVGFGATAAAQGLEPEQLVQKVTEEVMVNIANHVHARTGLDALCLAGGVALNCVGNGKILKKTPFKKIWIQPAAGDAGAPAQPAPIDSFVEGVLQRVRLRAARRPKRAPPTTVPPLTARPPSLSSTAA